MAGDLYLVTQTIVIMHNHKILLWTKQYSFNFNICCHNYYKNRIIHVGLEVALLETIFNILGKKSA